MTAPVEVRVLFAGAKKLPLKRRPDVLRALSDACGQVQEGRPARLVHCQRGTADTMAAEAWAGWSEVWPELYLPAEPHPDAEPAEVVALGAQVCVSVVTSTLGGSARLARAARAAGVRTVDYGLNTGRRS